MGPRKRKRITCIFCGDENVESSGEDVFPKWIAKKLAYISEQQHPEHAPDYIEHTYERTEDFSDDTKEGTPGGRAVDHKRRGSKPLIDKLPNVCTTCNGGWMARLEGGAKLILEGFIFGRTKTLDPYDEFVVATWITKTCLTHDAGHEEPWIPNEMGSRRFYETGYPLYGVHAMIGHDPNHTPEGALVHVRGPRMLGHWDDGGTFVAVHFAFQFDHLLVRAIVNCFDVLAVAERREGIGLNFESPHYVEVWPDLRRVSWPSNESQMLRTFVEPTRRTEERAPDSSTGSQVTDA